MKLANTLFLALAGVKAEPEGDVEHRKNIQSIVIDQNWKDFDERAELLFAELFPGVVTDPDFLANEQMIREQDQEMCAVGKDPNGKRVVCDTNDRDGSTAPRTKYQTPARKFRQLKIIVLWLQKEQRFGRYCYYGCHCLPEGSHVLGANTYGEPVDNIDRSCKNFNQCYECAKLGNAASGIAPDETCDGATRKYRFKLIQNLDDNSKSIECINKEGTCERNICECDKRLAENLAKWEDTWDINRHTRQGDGTWKFNEQCNKKGRGLFGRPESCCGNTFPDMIPQQKGKECCGHRPYDPNNLDRQCCDDNKIRPQC